MKKIFLLFSILLSVQSLFAKITFIGGHFEKPKAKTVTIQYYISALNFIERHNTKQDLNIDNNNNFMFEIETDIPICFNLMNGDNWVFINKYAAPGDSLWFEFKKEGTNINGICEECVGFMFEWEEKFLSNRVVNEEFNSSYSRLEPKEFMEYWNKRRKDQLDYFNEFVKNKKVPERFRDYMEAEINYDYAVSILQYSWRKKSAKGSLKDTAYLKFLDNIKIDNPSALISNRYLFFLREFPYSLWSTNIDFKQTDDPVNKYILNHQTQIRDSIAKKYFTKKVYDLALYQILNEELKNAERLKGKPYYESYLQRTDSLFFLYQTSFNDQSYYDRLIKKLQEQKDTISVSKDFILKDISGKEVRLSDFKGKVVYLDFWATTCAPCVAEIPLANKLKEKFKDKNVVFVYVSLDHSIDKLKKFIESRSFQGIHLIAPKGFASDVADMYQITSIPHYFLIDKNGILFNRDAPRPSSNPEDLIENLLK